ncbi:RNA recognition domain-containing protein [Loa loa]|uniref:RNA recognition domain-containing protein n=1 Tax=Loa loa TaxID=7209 RepID=A0A1I7VSI8_LOALO|nr:RNA recognition domain-containing protein [Loa loa]EJD76605.1 RNA recognition domain-containing protein [Loa loa]
MSRLIVKGLPSNCTEEKLRDHFGSFGTITDCSLKYTIDGKFRRFAFVGFETDGNAQKARENLHNTFMGASRLTVEECKPFGDDTKPRAWSKYAKGSSAYKRLHPEEEEEKTKEIVSVKDSSPSPKKMRNENDEEFHDFIQVQKGAPPTASSSNDESSNNSLMEELLSGISGNTSLSLIISGFPRTVKAKGIKDWFSPIKLKGIKISRGSTEAIAFVTFFQQSDVRKALRRNGQFFGGSKLEVTKVSSNRVSDDGMEDYIHKTREAEVEASVAKILETGRLFVRNLPYVCSDEDLRYLFKKYGEISDLQVIISKKTGQCKGFAIVTYVFPESAVAAFSALDGSILKGRMLHILPGEEKREVEETGITGKSAFQKAKFAKLKKDAGKSHSWNTLFLGANAVAETLAEKLDVEKSDLLLGQGEIGPGVRLALAETRLVNETREYLLANGVCLDVFSRPAAKRSNTVIIIKNLTTKVDIDELKRMFARHGPVKQLLMPPGGITAILEMENSIDAQKAFSTLAYTRFRSQPLFLEWAPYDLFKSGKLESKDEDKSQKQHSLEVQTERNDNEFSAEDKKKLRRSKKHQLIKEPTEVAESQKKAESVKTINETIARDGDMQQRAEVEKYMAEIRNEDSNDDAEEEDDRLLPGTTLFVKNLSFKTTDEGLKNKFESRFRIRSATVSKKRDAVDPTKALSMGFGFITFYQPEDAQQAIKEMQGVLLDGHCLMLKLSHREVVPDKITARKGVVELEQGEATKILIRNIPFQATRKEVKQLFATFGEIRSFRMPKKVGASAEGHRGFGFVDFLTRSDARRAFSGLVHSTHFYGRRLVLEWAKPDNNLEELREKAAASLSGNKGEVRLQKKMMKKIEQDLTVIDDD